MLDLNNLLHYSSYPITLVIMCATGSKYYLAKYIFDTSKPVNTFEVLPIPDYILIP